MNKSDIKDIAYSLLWLSIALVFFLCICIGLAGIMAFFAFYFGDIGVMIGLAVDIILFYAYIITFM